MKPKFLRAQYESPKAWALLLPTASICTTSADNATIGDVDYIDYGEI